MSYTDLPPSFPPSPVSYQSTPLACEVEHLNLLSIFHFILAGLTAIFGCIPGIYILIGFLFLTKSFPAPTTPSDPGFPLFMGWIFIIMGFIGVVIGWTIAVLLLLGGLELRKRRRYVFCIVVAAVGCLMFPFGTILGVFTLIVLTKPGVKVMFAGNRIAQPAAASG